MIRGSCLCQAHAFTINRPLRAARLCHCGNCTKFAGTSPAAWAMADSDALSVTKADAGIVRYDSGRGRRCSCATCGSPLWFESLEHPEIIAIPLGVLDSGEIPAPEFHLWIRSKPAWCKIHDDLPQYDTYPESLE